VCVLAWVLPVLCFFFFFLLSQADAHMLAMGLQRFYLSSASPDDKTARMRQQLLKDFHEKQEDFKWEALLEAAWDF